MRVGTSFRKAGRSLFAGLALAGGAACTRAPGPPTLVGLMDAPPTTLNPRMAIDAASQRLNSLLLRGLTHLDANLDPEPDLAERWTIENAGLRWRFFVREGQRDHEGEAITPERLAACLENYRTGQPASPFRGAFPHWIATHIENGALVLEMSKPDPYFLRNLVLLRYFRVAGHAEPCADPGSEGTIIGSGAYRAVDSAGAEPGLTPESSLTLIPLDPSAPRLRYEFVRDDNTKLLKLLRGEADFVQNDLSIPKVKWVEAHAADRFRVLERDGINVTYLAYNLRDPALAKAEVRRALAFAIPRDAIVGGRLGRFGAVAGSLLAPSLTESAQAEFPYDPGEAERLLERAGYPRDAKGTRLTFHFKSTPIQESIETALILQNELRKIGVELVLDVVEPAVFFASIRQHAFQLYVSRWVGVADGSLLYSTLHTGQPNNRVGYSDPAMDRLLEEAASELDLPTRAHRMHEVQAKMAADLPYFPLWYWNNALVLRRDLTGLESTQLSRSGGYEPLAAIRLPPASR